VDTGGLSRHGLCLQEVPITHMASLVCLLRLVRCIDTLRLAHRRAATHKCAHWGGVCVSYEWSAC
jgi:hypothetical protein